MDEVEITEAELTQLQNRSVAALAHMLPPVAAQLLVAIPALCDEIRHVREALRLACEELRGPGVPIDDLVADYLRAASTAHEK